MASQWITSPLCCSLSPVTYLPTSCGFPTPGKALLKAAVWSRASAIIPGIAGPYPAPPALMVMSLISSSTPRLVLNSDDWYHGVGCDLKPNI